MISSVGIGTAPSPFFEPRRPLGVNLREAGFMDDQGNLNVTHLMRNKQEFEQLMGRKRDPEQSHTRPESLDAYEYQPFLQIGTGKNFAETYRSHFDTDRNGILSKQELQEGLDALSTAINENQGIAVYTPKGMFGPRGVDMGTTASNMQQGVQFGRQLLEHYQAASKLDGQGGISALDLDILGRQFGEEGISEGDYAIITRQAKLKNQAELESSGTEHSDEFVTGIVTPPDVNQGIAPAKSNTIGDLKELMPLLQKADVNKDGKVTEDELKEYREYLKKKREELIKLDNDMKIADIASSEEMRKMQREALHEINKEIKQIDALFEKNTAGQSLFEQLSAGGAGISLGGILQQIADAMP